MQNKQQRLEVPFVNTTGLSSPEDIIPYLERLVLIPIQSHPWPHYAHSVKADYMIAYSDSAIFLKYVVQENSLRAKASTNGNIHHDSCVEFFIELDGNGNYYNLEFNCLGRSKIGYGSSRTERDLLSPNLVESVSSISNIKSSTTDSMKLFSWEIILAIPLTVFYHSNLDTLRGLKARGNFYKCGDKLPQPHYLTWNFIESENPDFHRPEYFGNIEFV